MRASGSRMWFIVSFHTQCAWAILRSDSLFLHCFAIGVARTFLFSLFICHFIILIPSWINIIFIHLGKNVCIHLLCPCHFSLSVFLIFGFGFDTSFLGVWKMVKVAGGGEGSEGGKRVGEVHMMYYAMVTTAGDGMWVSVTEERQGSSGGEGK